MYYYSFRFTQYSSIRLQVRDSKGHVLSQHEDVSKGKFSFVTETFDTFEICFVSRVPARKSIFFLKLPSRFFKLIFLDQRGIGQQILLVTKHGVEAKSYEGVSHPTFVNI